MIVPMLVFCFELINLQTNSPMQIAIGTSLATIVITSLSSIKAHHSRGAVQWFRVKQLAPGLFLGAAAGGLIAKQISSVHLELIFGVFLLVSAWRMAFSTNQVGHLSLPKTLALTTISALIGCFSALVGIGGGTLNVPFLTRYQTPVREAIATSAACGFPIAFAGSISFILAGSNHSDLPNHTIGYLYWPAFLGISVFSMLSAPYGAKLAHSLQISTLKKCFAVFMMLVGLNMLMP